MRTRIDLILGVTLALGTVGTIRAASLDVPAEYPTIQDAIDAASTGDEILVAPGTYTGDGFWRIDFGGKDLRLRGTGGAEATILDLENFYGPAFVFDSGETAASLVEGFSILDVRGNSLGGAFRIIGASPTISKCLIAGNQAVAFMVAFGGGLYIANGSPTLVDCTIAENLASTDAPRAWIPEGSSSAAMQP